MILTRTTQFACIIIFICGCRLAVAQTSNIELVASLDQAVGNIAYSHDGSLVISHHPFFKPAIRVARFDLKTNKLQAFPNKEWNTEREANDWFLDDVLGVRSDSQGIVWMLDMGTRSDVTPKLVAWNTVTDQLERVVYIPSPASIESSQLNDFVIDESRQLIVIADEGIARGGDGSKAALVVVDLKTGLTRRVLEGHFSTAADRSVPIMIEGKELSVESGGKRTPIFVGADGITLDRANEWLYFAPLNGQKIYRIRIAKLANGANSDEILGSLVETYSEKVNNGGLSIDEQGNLYFTNVETNSIGFVSPKDRKYSVLAEDKRMLWPDGLSYSQDGYMYVSAAQVHLGAAFNGGVDKTSKPFFIFRFKPLAGGIFGR